MKTIQTDLIITGIRAKVDGSLGLTCSTPELSVGEKVAVLELQNQNVDATFVPIDEPAIAEMKINKDLEQKTPSQRLRGVLYVMWKQSGENGAWEAYYKQKMENILDQLKAKLDD